MSTKTVDNLQTLPESTAIEDNQLIEQQDSELSDDEEDSKPARGINHDLLPHEDQSNVPEGKYRAKSGKLLFTNGHTYSVGLGRPIGSINPATPFLNGELLESDILKLSTFSKNDLLNLIKDVSGAIWGYALQNDQERAEAAALRLYASGMNTSETHKMIPALREWFDRTQGKATQYIKQEIEHSAKTQPNELTNNQLIAALRNANVAGLLPGNVKLLANGDIVDAEYSEVKNPLDR